MMSSSELAANANRVHLNQGGKQGADSFVEAWELPFRCSGGCSGTPRQALEATEVD